MESQANRRVVLPIVIFLWKTRQTEVLSYHLLSQNLYRWSSAGTMSISKMYLVLGFIPVTLTL